MNMAWLSRGAATAERNRRRMHLTGVTPNGYRLWDHFEQSALSDHYPDYDAALRVVVRRTRPAAHSKASRMGITRPRGREWDYNELVLLRRLYRDGTRQELMDALPGRSWFAISSAARSRHIYRRKKAYKPADLFIVDQILERAYQRNWSLRELDEAAGRRNYFRHRRWKKGRLDFKAICRALSALGGHPRARWIGPLSADFALKAE